MSGLGWLKGTPALRQVLRICLHTRDPPEHSAARSVIRAFCRGNAEGQAMLAATLVPVADQDPGPNASQPVQCRLPLVAGSLRLGLAASYQQGS